MGYTYTEHQMSQNVPDPGKVQRNIRLSKGFLFDPARDPERMEGAGTWGFCMLRNTVKLEFLTTWKPLSHAQLHPLVSFHTFS